MALSKIKRSLGPACRGGITAVCILSITLVSLRAEERRFRPQSWRGPDQAKQTEDKEPDATVRLGYSSAKWQKVLEDVAEAFDKKLVADRVPSGRFSRRDRGKHELKTALKILNRALAKKHFRVVIKGDFLVLLDKESVRPKYRAAVVSARNGHLRDHDDKRVRSKSRRNKSNIQLAGHEEATSDESNFLEGPRRIQPRKARRKSSARPASSKRPPAAQIDSAAIELSRRSAVDVARTIYRGFDSAARLVDSGPEGLPGFLVTHRVTRTNVRGKQQSTPPLKLAVGIDADKNELIVEGPEKQVESFLDLVETLDGSRETIQLVAGKADVSKMERSLRPVLRRLQLAQAEKEAVKDGKKQPIPNPADPKAGLQGLVGGLKGDVGVEAVPDLGILILRGNEADTAAVMKIIDEIQRLSKGVAPDVEVRMLQHVRSKALADLLTQLYEKLIGSRNEATQQRQPIVVLPIVTPNAVIILAPATDMPSVLKLADELDQPVAADTQFQVFRLKSGVATEVVEIVKEFYEERGGLGPEVKITADVRTNSVLLHAGPRDMKEIGSLIGEIDQPSQAVAEIKVFKLFNADALAIVQILDTLFQTGGQNRDQEGGLQLAGADDASSNLLPPQFTADLRTNTVVARGGAETLRVAEAVLLRLDADKIRERETTVYRLKNSPSDEVAGAINEFLAQRQDVDTRETDLGSNVAIQAEREVIVVSETISNSLIISASQRFYQDIHDLVVKLDAAPAEVTIQALLVEVELDNTDEFGVELGFQDSLLFNRSIISPEDITTITESLSDPATGIVTTTQRIISQASTPGFPFNNQPLGNNTINPSRVGSQGLSNFAVGRTNGELGFGGLVLSASSESVSVLLRALAEVRSVEILSRPQIRTLDNQLAEIKVGQVVPVANGVTLNSVGSANPRVEQQDAGIILKVKPRITPDGRVVMEVMAEKSKYDLTPGAGVPIFSDAISGNVVEAPIKDITNALAVVSAKSGQTIVLGGMITKSTVHVERKVPILGDIPFLGAPFRYDFDQNQRRELLIFLTPRIIHDDATSEWIKQVEAERVHFYAEEAEAIHGPIFALPEEIESRGSNQEQPPLILPPVEQSDEEGIPTSMMSGKGRATQAKSERRAGRRPRLLPARDEEKATPLFGDDYDELDDEIDGPVFIEE